MIEEFHSLYDVEDEKLTSELRSDALFRRLLSWYRADLSVVEKWRCEAREDFDFYNGEQWDDVTLSKLKEQNRPYTSFNKIAPVVNAVIGTERNNKREVQFIPRKAGIEEPCDLLTGAGEWFRQRAFAEYADSEAFKNAVICGMGWTDTGLDYVDNPDGDPRVLNLDPLKMMWDCSAVQMNLSDAKRLWYVDRKPLSEAMMLFPHVRKEDLHAGWSDGLRYGGGNEEYYYRDDHGIKTVTLVECRWKEVEYYYRVANRETDEIVDLTELQYKELQKIYPYLLESARCSREVVRRVYIGRKVLSKPDVPLVPKGSFGWECITGYRHVKHRHFYGIVRAMKDPQRWHNKYYSQSMHILNTQSKGGVMAERGAFDDEDDAVRSWAKVDAITWVKSGALAANKIQQKPNASFPSGFFNLFNEAKESITQVTGLSPEFIGTREVNQAGILEAQRRQSSLNLLAELFDSLKLYRYRQGKIILYLIQNYLADGRVIRIIGDDNARYLQLMREDIINIEYDIIVDDAPTSPNEKERTFGIIMQLLPLLKDLVTPEIMFELLKYSPLPATLVTKVREAFVQMRQQQMMMEQMQVPQQVQSQDSSKTVTPPVLPEQVSPDDVLVNQILGISGVPQGV